MKATIMLLAAMAASMFSTGAARAQQPIEPVGFGHSVAKGGSVAGDCGCDQPCGKLGFFDKFGHKGCKDGLFSGCGKHGCGKDGCGKQGCLKNGCGSKCCLLNWLCRPLPSNAPTCRGPEYPLGFPMHPYLRSPRDYFMMEP